MIVEVDDGSFEEAVLASDIPMLVDFGAKWCGPCLAMAPMLEAIAGELSGVIGIVKVDVETSPALAARYSVRNMPTLVMFKNGEAVDARVGAGQPRSSMIKWLDSFI
ncbi:MAG TPA: thioredoxin [Devosia sp.]|jgi:thioredoxin 1|uniref:thioredoxin n=1 Tax=Devosia sp. TaxID=1871048 RepID=UPI002F9282E0